MKWDVVVVVVYVLVLVIKIFKLFYLKGKGKESLLDNTKGKKVFEELKKLEVELNKNHKALQVEKKKK